MTSLDFRSLVRLEKAKQKATLATTSPAESGYTRSPITERDVQHKIDEDSGVDIDTDVGHRVEKYPGSSARSEEWATGLKRTRPWTQLSLNICKRTPLDFDKMSVGRTPSIYYIPDFVSTDEEREILSRTYAVPRSSSDWVTLKSRRLQCWGGQPGENFKHEALPVWLNTLCDALVNSGIFSESERPNHVLLNEYQPGQGIMPHTDGPYYAPRTATLSLGSDAIMHFYPRIPAADIGTSRASDQDVPVSSVILRQRSLVMFTQEAYANLMHGIDPIEEEIAGSRGAPIVNEEEAGVSKGSLIKRDLRVSLTFRRVMVEGEGLNLKL